MKPFFLICTLFTLTATAATPKEDFSLRRDVIYETLNGVEVKLDLAIPAGPGPFPLVLCIHGGAFHVGDKSKFTPMIERLAGHDFVAASINYRLAPKVHFPAPLDDTKAALYFLKKRAVEFKIDPTRVGGTGESAGAHMAMLLAFEESKKNDSDAGSLTAMRFNAIVNYYGPCDLTCWDVSPMVDFMWQQRFHEPMGTTMLKFLGSETKDGPEVKAASPINYICSGCPPVLTFHGTLDPVVPFSQAQMLHAALKKAGVIEKLVPIPNGLHGGWIPEAREKADKEAVAFFEQYLRGAGGTKGPTHEGAERHANVP